MTFFDYFFIIISQSLCDLCGENKYFCALCEEISFSPFINYFSGRLVISAVNHLFSALKNNSLCAL